MILVSIPRSDKKEKQVNQRKVKNEVIKTVMN